MNRNLATTLQLDPDSQLVGWLHFSLYMVRQWCCGDLRYLHSNYVICMQSRLHGQMDTDRAALRLIVATLTDVVLMYTFWRGIRGTVVAR